MLLPHPKFCMAVPSKTLCFLSAWPLCQSTLPGCLLPGCSNFDTSRWRACWTTLEKPTSVSSVHASWLSDTLQSQSPTETVSLQLASDQRMGGGAPAASGNGAEQSDAVTGHSTPPTHTPLSEDIWVKKKGRRKVLCFNQNTGWQTGCGENYTISQRWQKCNLVQF